MWHVLPLFKGILYLLICFVFTYNHWFYFVLLPIFAQTLMVRFIALGTRTSSTEKCNGTVIHVKIYTQHDSSLAPHRVNDDFFTSSLCFLCIVFVCETCSIQEYNFVLSFSPELLNQLLELLVNFADFPFKRTFGASVHVLPRCTGTFLDF